MIDIYIWDSVLWNWKFVSIQLLLFHLFDGFENRTISLKVFKTYHTRLILPYRNITWDYKVFAFFKILYKHFHNVYIFLENSWFLAAIDLLSYNPELRKQLLSCEDDYPMSGSPYNGKNSVISQIFRLNFNLNKNRYE